MKGFEIALQVLTEKKDKQAGYLLIAVAADKRREKDFDGALQSYQEVIRNYPSDAEDALWGAGWTQYLSGDYPKAAETFSRLYATYGDMKYLYWQAKSISSSGGSAEELFSKVMTAENSFYAALAFSQNSTPMPRPAPAAFTPVPAVEKTRSQERIDALISLGMRQEAVTELVLQCRQISGVSDLVSAASLFQDLGEYKRAISLVTKAPYSEQLHRFWYPLAFWDKVEETARRNRIDPYIVLSVMREESRFDQSAKSPAGAYGLMQLMPQTAYRLDRNLNLGISRPSQLTDPGNNIALGTYYLKKLSEEFSSLPLALAAYNAGETAVKSWQHRFAYRSADEFIEDIPYAETRNYVKKVLTSYFQYRRTSAPEADSGKSIDAILGRM
jgi:soluble lytic murein transglycosylase